MTENLPTKAPEALIELALQSGADLDKLEKLLKLKKEYDMEEARKAYYKAMAEFKANVPRIEKGRRVNYAAKSGGMVNYIFADLATIVDKVSAELSKHGLSVSWRTQQNGKVIVTCKITHEQGYSEETSLSADPDTSGYKNPIQAVGSTISYLQRYSLVSILGLAIHGVDDDGQASEEKLDENKLRIIKEGLQELKMDEKSFLTYMGVEAIEDISAKNYVKAKTALETKRRENAGNKLPAGK